VHLRVNCSKEEHISDADTPEEISGVPGKFYRSVGDADAETVLQYVRDQRLEQTSLNNFPYLELPTT
jgi:hypothetical protein